MNNMDLAVIIILVLFILAGYRRGLALTILNFSRTILSLFLASYLYPDVSKFIRESTGLYNNFKTAIVDNMGLSKVVQDTTLKASTEFINNLTIPEFLKTALIANNNPEYYRVLQVDALEGYIAGYISNMIINAISLVVVFAIVYVLMQVLVNALDLVSKLPVINTFNKLGGSLIGFLQGTLLIWILIVVLVFFFSSPDFAFIFDMIQQSTIAIYFYQTNIILNFITNVYI